MYYDDDENYWNGNNTREHYSRNFDAPAGVHIMNKNESKMLRKLKIKTGLTEVEIRNEKKYRKMLSEAQKEVGNKSRFIRRAEGMLKSITKELKLPNEHPLVIEMFDERIKNSRLSSSWMPPKAKDLIKTIERYKKSKKLSK